MKKQKKLLKNVVVNLLKRGSAEDQAADAMAQFRSLQAEHTKLSASLAASTK